MTKYEPLTRHLAARHEARVQMQFSDIERLLGFPLPRSARRHRPWWANSGHGHVQSKAWLDAGFESRDVNLESERLEFVRLNTVTPAAGQARKDHPLWGALAGMITVAPGVDLTAPMFTDEEMDEWLDEKARRIAEGMR